MAETIPNESSVVEVVSEMVQIPIAQEAMPVDLPFEVEDKVTIEMEEMIQGCGDGGFQPECCIYRVPIVLRGLKPKAYTPKLVSIGPFYHGHKTLRDIERHKQILFRRFTQKAKSSLNDLVRCVKYLEPRVRASYSETIDFSEQKLVKLILMDAAFIIEFFIMMYEGDDKDITMSQPWLAYSITEDLILLENQLPFFVIEELFNKALPHDRRDKLPPFLWLTCYVFKYFGQKLESIPEGEIKHFTDLIRLSYVQGKMTERDSSSKAENQIRYNANALQEAGIKFKGRVRKCLLHWKFSNLVRWFYLKKKMTKQHSSLKAQSHIRYNANALQEAGIKFKARESKCLLDLKFSGHTLEIPQISVDDSTEILFRNMIALEQCHYPHASYITEYTSIMDWLIDTYKDVDILVHNEIVINDLGNSKSVASLFNGLGENVLRTSFNAEYCKICKDLNDYCQDRWRKTKLALRRDYCNTPWRTVASFAGIILLLLTIVQTIFSVLQVYLNKYI